MNPRIFIATLLLAFILFGCVNTQNGTPTQSIVPSGSPVSTQPVAGVATIEATNSVSSEFLLYSSEQYEIKYPKGWTVRQDDNVVLFQSPAEGPEDSLQENVNVIMTPTDQTLEAFVQAALGSSVQSPGFKLIDSKEVKLSGNPAQRVVYSEESGEGNLQYLQEISVSQGQAVIVTYTATPETFAKYQDQAEAMIATFQLKAQTKASATSSVQPLLPTSSMAPEIVRKWRVYSEAIFYDSGGNNFLETPVTTLLELKSDQTWTFGSSSGTWSVQSIQESDWQKWGVNAYGPTRKLVLEGWNDETNDGPMEESGSRVDFMWVIYRVGPPSVSSPGQIQMKFGQTYGG